MTESTRPGPVRRVLTILSYAEDGLLVGLLSVMILLAGYQILARNLFDYGLVWGDPLLRVLVLWVGLMGAMVATREDNHITIDVLSRMLSGRPKTAMRIFVDLFTSGVCGVLAFYAGKLVLEEKQYGEMAFAQVPSWVCQSILPIAFGIISIRYALYLILHCIQLVKGDAQ